MWKFKSELKLAKESLLNISYIDEEEPEPVSISMIYSTQNHKVIFLSYFFRRK